MAQAVAELSLPRIKPVRPMPSYKGRLTLGNPAAPETLLSIDVERYPRTMVARPPTASQFVLSADPSVDPNTDPAQPSTSPVQDGEGNDSGLAAVHSTRKYHVLDPRVEGGKRDVPFEDLAKGYEYGRTAVHISEADQTVTNFETTAGLELLGFVARDKVGDYDLEIMRWPSTIDSAFKTSLPLSSTVQPLNVTSFHLVR